MMYFPRPYPDELVGSLLLRACRHTGLPMYAIVSRLSYHGCGHRTLFRSGLFAQLSSAIHLPATEIVEQHTLFPYITRFVKDSRRKALLASASSLSAQSVLQFGHFAKRVCYACRGRYCPVCAAADLAQFGETYWHRLHCLPGMRLCPYHRCALVSHVYSGRPDGKETTPPSPNLGDEQGRQMSDEVCDLEICSAQALSGDLVLQRYEWAFGRQAHEHPNNYGPHILHALQSRFGESRLIEMQCWTKPTPWHCWTAQILAGEPGNFPAQMHVLLHALLKSGFSQDNHGI